MEPNMNKKKIIIDCDPGIDDAIALMLALASPELEVLGITTISGNIEVNACAENAFQVLKLMGREDIPVYKGASVPLVREFHDATDTHGLDGLGEVNLPKTGLAVKEKSAEDFIIETIKEQPYEVTLIALGPLTTIAKALRKDINTMKQVKEFIVMGGTDKFHGNCSPVTEFNFWVDPEADDEVFASNFTKIRMVGLDVTHSIIFSPNLREVANQIGGEKGKFVHDITRFYVDFHWMQERTLGCVINDPLVIAMLLDDTLVQFDDAYVEIETEGIAVGQSVCDADGKFHKGQVNAEVAHGVDVRRFFEILFTRLFPGTEKDIELSLNREFGERRIS